MIQILKHEIYKIFSSKEVYIALTLCLLVYALYVNSIAPSSFNNHRTVYKYYKSEEGFVTSQNILNAKKGMVELNKLYDQGIRFNDEELGKSLLYQDINTVVKEKANYIKLINELQNYKNKKEKLSYDIMKKVGPIVCAYYTEGWKSIINFWGDIGYYLILILAFFGISKIFPNEQVTGMDKLIKSTREGNRKLNIAKIIAAIIYVIAITTIFALVNILTNAFIYGLAGFHVPLKNIFIQTPYSIKIYQFWLLTQLMAIVIVSILGLLTMLISIITNSSVISFSVVGGCFLVYDNVTKAVNNNPAHGTVGFVITNFIRLKGFCTSYLNIYDAFGYAMIYEKVLYGFVFILFIGMIFTTYFASTNLISCPSIRRKRHTK